MGYIMKENQNMPNRHRYCLDKSENQILPKISPKRVRSNSPKNSIDQTAAVHENYSYFINKKSEKNELPSISPLR